MKFDTRSMPDATRVAAANKVHSLKDFNLPRLRYWNYELCRKHRNGWDEEIKHPETGEFVTHKVYDRPVPGCRDCAIHLAKHQRVAAMWLYLKKRALLADTMGAGKTASITGLLALMAETGELGQGIDAVGRAIVVPRAAALGQWQTELNRMVPALTVAVASGSPKARREVYAGSWDILLIGPETLRNDANLLLNFKLAAFVTDDIDALRNADTKTSYWCDRFGNSSDRYIITTGTPLQKRLLELHAVLDGIGGLEVLGSKSVFEKRYIRYEEVPTENGGFQRVHSYRNLPHLKKQINPLVLRRTAKDIDDVHMPTIVPDDIYLDLYPAQRAKYKELQKGVISLLKDGQEKVKHTTALSKIHYGASICAGMHALGEEDGDGMSVKLDWIMDKVVDGGDLGDEKIVIFGALGNDQPLDSGVLTPDRGWVKMGDIQVGDKVVSSDGASSEVSGVYYKGINPVYTVRFDDGTEAESSINHLWKFRSGRKHYVKGSGRGGHVETPDWQVGTLAELVSVMEADKNTAKMGESQYYPQVPMLDSPVTYNLGNTDLPLHPYILGVLLGDGTLGGGSLDGDNGNVTFCTIDPGITEKVRAHLPDGVSLVKAYERDNGLIGWRFVGTRPAPVIPCVEHGNGTCAVNSERIRGLCKAHYLRAWRAGTIDSYEKSSVRNGPISIMREILEGLNLWGVRGSHKYIPEMYLYADNPDDRLQVIQGLMDTDGDESGTFTNTSVSLAHGIATLARSLGIWSNFRFSHVNKHGSNIFITSVLTDKFDIAHLDRKKYKSSVKGVKRVVSVEYSRESKTQCIAVTHPQHLYMTDGYTLTHNTLEALQRRLDAEHIGHVTIWGKDRSRKNRLEAQNKFWDDPNCRVLMGTQAIEQSLNLQVSRHLINIDMILNPARMDQLAGRIRRSGSKYQHVFVHNLLAADTQEARYVKMIEKEAALAAHIWDENSELFRLMDANQILRLISGK